MPHHDPRPLVFATLDDRRPHFQGRAFGILPDDLARHMYVIGASGTGKSTLLERLITEQIHRGHGVALLDPHGDLAERVIAAVPRERRNDLVYFDPAVPERRLSLNLLECHSVDARPLVVAGVMGIFRRLYGSSWGPRLEHVLRNTLFALLDTRGTTLLDGLVLLSDARRRERFVSHVTDPVVRLFWTKEFPAYPPAFAEEMLSPVRNKLAAVLTSPVLRDVFGRPRSTLRIPDVMDRGRILVANLAKGRIGEEASSFLGAALVMAIQLATYARANLPLAERRSFTLYVDEFASFVTPSFGELLAEARKYGLALVLAHQHLGQLDEWLRRAIFGNVGTMVVFRVAAEDARILLPELQVPSLNQEDLRQLQNHRIVARLHVAGIVLDGLTATVAAAPT